MAVEDLDELLQRLEHLLATLQDVDPELRGITYELLDGVDALHRFALRRLESMLGTERVSTLRDEDPAVAWLFDAYAVGVDERVEVEAALVAARPYIESHGGSVEVVDAAGGVVQLRMGGTCQGCTAAAQTLRDEIETALRDGFAGFSRVEVEADDAAPHPPPVITRVELGPTR
jgi:Fe-S cluster biogenesis protein NfuA